LKIWSSETTRRKQRETIEDIVTGNAFLNKTPKAQETKEELTDEISSNQKASEQVCHSITLFTCVELSLWNHLVLLIYDNFEIFCILKEAAQWRKWEEICTSYSSKD
jgi:hypothetical protein